MTLRVTVTNSAVVAVLYHNRVHVPLSELLMDTWRNMHFVAGAHHKNRG